MAEIRPADDPDATDAAVALLRAAKLVAIPTETVYGLAADAANPAAIANVFATKGRPTDHPLIVHLANADELDRWADPIPDEARTLAAAFWPGPLTLVLRRTSGVLDAITGGRDTVAVRVPAHPATQRLLAAFGAGLAAPSANRFGRVSPTTAADVAAELGDSIPLVLDGGACRVGVESTIIDLTTDVPEILRPGGIGAAALAAAIGRPVVRTAHGPARAPGMLPSHYAPRARVELVDDLDTARERAANLVAAGRSAGVLAAGEPDELAVADGVVALALGVDTATQAAALYVRLRDADRRSLDVVVAVAPAGDEALATAIGDRLRRAATPRPG